MKYIYALAACCLMMAASAQPQRSDRKENVEAMKIAFLTRHLNLTPAEAEKFWPVYNQYTDELSSIRKDRRQRFRDAREEYDQMDDKTAERLIDEEIASRQKELDVLKKYHQQFKSVIPVKKLARLYRAD